MSKRIENFLLDEVKKARGEAMSNREIIKALNRKIEHLEGKLLMKEDYILWCSSIMNNMPLFSDWEKENV